MKGSRIFPHMGLLAPFISYVVRDTVRSKTLLTLILTVLTAASAAILLTHGVLVGFRTMLVDGERGWLGDVVISPRGGDTNIRLSDEIEKKLTAMSEVEAFSTRSYGQVIVRYEEKKTTPFRTLGISPANDRRVTWLESKIIEGTYFADSHSTDEVLLGKGLADDLVGIEGDGRSVHAGDLVNISMPDGTYRSMRVRGILDAKNFSPNWILYFQKSDLDRMDAGGRNAQMIVKLKQGIDPMDVREQLQNAFPTVVVRTWEEESQYVRDIMEAVSFITLSIKNLLVVTIFLVISIVIYIDVNQKRRQIGIVKSMGAPNSFVILAYVTQAFLYAIVGACIGSAVFLLVGYWSRQHPIPLLIGDFQLLSTMSIFAQTIVAVFLSALIGAFSPAWLAAKGKIIDDMRGRN